MIDSLNDSATPSIPALNSIKFDFDMIDEPKKPKKSKKHKKGGKKGKKGKGDRAYNREYAKLAFQYGVLCSRYDTLERMVKLSIAVKRGQLNDKLLNDGLTALELPRAVSLPEL